ncbi:hypothetical protein [Leucobacter sp. GX24907]
MTERAENRGAHAEDPAERGLTETVQTGVGPDNEATDEDVVTDPARDDRVGSDWADEGGAPG